MKPQSSTEEFSVFSNRIYFNGNNRGIVSCFIALQGIGAEAFLKSRTKRERSYKIPGVKTK